MDYYYHEDEDELGTIELDGTQAIVLVVDDSAFTENQPLELVEGADTVFILVRRGIIEQAAGRVDGEVLGEQVLAAASSILATWKVLSQ